MNAEMKTEGFLVQTRLRWFLYLGLVLSLFAMVFVLHARLDPSVHPVGTDSGVFLYTGQRILAGDVLYRDVWDHKPPGIHFINAIALGLAGETPWAMWWMEVVWVTLSAVVLIATLHRIMDLRLACFAAIMYLGTMHLPHLLRDFNFTETFAQLPQYLSVLFCLLYFDSKKLRWVALMGFSVSFTFFIRQTDIGLACILFVLLLTTIHTWKQRRLAFLAFIAGGLVIPLAALIYWGSQAALADLWSGIFGYNLEYTANSNIFNSVYEAIVKLSSSYPLVLLFSMTMGLLFSQLGRSWWTSHVKSRTRDKNAADEKYIDLTPTEFLEAGICLALPLNLLLVNLSGRNYGHYYQSILPTLVIGSTLLINKTLDKLSPPTRAHPLNIGIAGVLSAMFLGWALQLGTLITPEFEQLKLLAQPDTYQQVEHDGIVDYIQLNTGVDDRILIWGSEVSINFLSHRQSPSRYPSSLFVTLSGLGTQARLDEFLQSIRSLPPCLILFQDASDRPASEQFDPEVLCPVCSDLVLRSFERLRTFIVQNYMEYASVGDWHILASDECLSAQAFSLESYED